MSLKGYSFVTDQGYIAFTKDLEDSIWATIPAAPLTESGVLDADAILSSRHDSVLKGQVLYAIDQLGGAVNRAPSAATTADGGFDRQQRIFDAEIEKELLDDDPARVAAAQTLRSTLTLGDGTAQTSLSYQAEVDFGRKQAALSKQPEVASALALLGLTDRIARISEATERLAAAIGRADQDPSLTAYKRLTLARALCAATFNAVHTSLDQLRIISTPAARARFSTLLAPFEALLARHPRPQKSSPSAATSPEST